MFSNERSVLVAEVGRDYPFQKLVKRPRTVPGKPPGSECLEVLDVNICFLMVCVLGKLPWQNGELSTEGLCSLGFSERV